jgi:hypothetical protein
MKFANTGIEQIKADLNFLDDLMLEYGFVREGAWDYERVTYDRKFELEEGTFYLRIMGYATSGDVGANKATIQLMAPLLGKHYYPHGVEYKDEHFPISLVNECEKILNLLKQKVDEFLPAK